MIINNKCECVDKITKTYSDDFYIICNYMLMHGICLNTLFSVDEDIMGNF